MKAMIISLGGTPAPLIYSLNHQRPEYICFFVSEESRESINKDILPHLDFKPRHHDWIITSSAENLSECYRAIYQNLPGILKKWDIEPKDLIVDYTGGTKTMSVALALATIQNSSSYTYIGGVERTKEGVGIVINGKEKMWYLDNPWDELAVSERKEACILFNKARYAAASETFAKISEKVSQRNKAFFDALQDLAEGYDLWDKFKHSEARSSLYRSRKVIDASAFLSDKAEIVSLSNALKDNLTFLQEMEDDRVQKALLLCYDLLANAKRRAELENKFDDAMARLYRTIEAMAQFRLRSQYDIDTSAIRIDQIPNSLRENFKEKYTGEKEKKIRLPLYASYLVLKELNDELGHNFFLHYDKELRSILDLRNRSILAHGFNSVKEATFRKMYSTILDLTGIKEERIPEFPQLMI